MTIRLYDLGIPATPKGYILTPPPTIEHPEQRHWHVGGTDMKESDPDKGEREHPHDTDVEEPDLCETEREEPNNIACVPFHYARVPPLCMDSAIVSNFPSGEEVSAQPGQN